MRIRLLMLGKTRRPEIISVLEDYVKRIGRTNPVEVTEVRDGAAAVKKLAADRSVTALLLDPGGKAMNSEAFSRWIGEQRDRGTREIVFLCGDADGFPEVVREKVKSTISLSSMTFSHELARLMLAEQIYRAFAILSNSPYPK